MDFSKLVLLRLFLASALLLPIPAAYALTFTVQVTPDPGSLGLPMTALVETNDDDNGFDDVEEVAFRWLDPSGTIRRGWIDDDDEPYTDTIPGNLVDMVGYWEVQARFELDDDWETQHVFVSQLVVPEFPIGTLAAVISASGAFGLLVIRRKSEFNRKKN